MHLEASATDHGTVYQVGRGVQNINHTHYVYNSATGPSNRLRPLDLPQLRRWIDHLLTEYSGSRAASGESKREKARHDRQLRALSGSIHDSLGKEQSKDVIRRLIVAGMVEYLSMTETSLLTATHEHIMLDLVVFCAWPIVQIPRLPSTWQTDLGEITGPRLAAVVAAAREANTKKNPVSCESFVRAVASRPFDQSILGILEDLGDPRRGGGALIALAAASRLPAPPNKGGGLALLGWVLAGIASGAGLAEDQRLADRIANFVSSAWAWTTGSRNVHPTSLTSNLPTGDHTAQLGIGGHHHGGFLSDLMDDLFNNH
jgi:hypothetical protein